ncbi:MAG: tyrosine-type recombinase/integrase [Cyclobacteriaceae bacterium]
MLREARRSGHSLNINEDELRNPPAQKKKVVWLNRQELRDLEKVEVLTIQEQKALDCWLFRAYSGLRHNEMNQVDIKKILDGFIDINDTKKRSVKSIEVPQPAVNILESNNGRLPHLSQQSENVLIKRLAKRAELNRIVYTSCVVDKKYRDGEFELHQTITTHDARRTFASICYREFNLSLEVVRELLQHSSTDQTLEYIGASIRKAKIGGLFK